MKYLCTVISVSDISKSRKFYEDLFSLEAYHDYGKNIDFGCGLSLQEDFDLLVNIPKEKIINTPNNMELYFEEKQFDAFLARLRSYPDIRYIGDITEQSWGQRTVKFYDPDGHIIEVGESMKSVVERFLSLGLSMEETATRMKVTAGDLEKILSE